MKKSFFIILLSQLLLSSCFLDSLTPNEGILDSAGIWLCPADDVADGYKFVFKKEDIAELWFTFEPDFNTFKRYTCVARICNDNNEPKNVKFIDEGKGFVEDDYYVHFSITKDNADTLTQVFYPDEGITRLRAVVPVKMLFPGEKYISCYITTNKGYSEDLGFHVKVVE